MTSGSVGNGGSPKRTGSATARAYLHSMKGDKPAPQGASPRPGWVGADCVGRDEGATVAGRVGEAVLAERIVQVGALGGRGDVHVQGLDLGRSRDLAGCHR